MRRDIVAYIVTALVISGLIVWFTVVFGFIVIESIVGICIGLFLSVAVFMLLTPLFIKMLVNHPHGRHKSGLHFFTYPEEGKIKIIVRGERVVRMIMLFARHHFARVENPGNPGYWQIIEGENEDPLTGISPLFFPWAWYVYTITGAVFTGIWPFQTVREYLVERTHLWREENVGNNNIRLEVVEDMSDHLRARQFLFPIRVAKADTKDKISVTVLIVIRAQVINPYLAAFNTDRWDHQLTNIASNAVTNYTRTHDLDAVLTAKSKAGANSLNEALLALHDDEQEYGIDIVGADIIDISPNLSEEESAQLYAEALAKSLGKATVIDGKARAEALTAVNEANAKGGEHAVETMRAEAMVRAAEAAKGGTILLGGNMGSNDPMQAAILAELKKLNEKEAN